MNVDINNLDLANVARWPAAARAVVILFLMGGVIFLGYWFHTKDQLAELAKVEERETGLKVIFETKAKQAVNLEAYEKQLEEMRESFGAMLRQLPGKTEIPNLLVDISQTGLAAGLKEKLFQPMGEVRKDFYAEKPIKIRLDGGFHEFGSFVSDIAGLPRIVTIHDIQIRPVGNDGEYDDLILDLTAKTYRYMEDEDLEEAS